MDVLQVNDTLTIPQEYLHFQVSRSSGPGGQNVNKLNTRVTLVMNLPDCPVFTDEQKQRLLKRLSGYADKQGHLHVSSQRYRSQYANRLDAAQRLAALIAQAVAPPVKRRKTAVPRAAVRKRLENKRRRAEIKQSRSAPKDN